MTKQQILQEVANSSWQPEFQFTDDLDAVVDSILKPHEDYFLGLHSKVKEIIERETNGVKTYSIVYNKPFQITFADVCNWQKELFEHKRELIDKIISPTDFYNLATDEEFDKQRKFKSKVANLPNQHINLGLRTTNVKVGEWNPPHPMFLEDLKEMCFPISIERIKNQSEKWFEEKTEVGKIKNTDLINYEELYISEIIEWYKIFESAHYFSDLNGRLGGIIVNILSYLLTGKYLILK